MSLFHRCKSCNNLPHPVKTCCHIWSFRNGTKNLNGTKDHKWLAWPISSKLAKLREKDTSPKWHKIAQKVTSPKWKTVGAYLTHKNRIQAKIHKVYANSPYKCSRRTCCHIWTARPLPPTGLTSTRSFLLFVTFEPNVLWNEHQFMC